MIFSSLGVEDPRGISFLGRQGRFVPVVMSSLVMKTVVLAVISVIEVKGNRWSGSAVRLEFPMCTE